MQIRKSIKYRIIYSLRRSGLFIISHFLILTKQLISYCLCRSTIGNSQYDTFSQSSTFLAITINLFRLVTLGIYKKFQTIFIWPIE